MDSINTSSNRIYAFKATIQKTEEQKPVFNISIPDDFLMFSKEQQGVLVSLILSQFESTSVFKRAEHYQEIKSADIGETLNRSIDLNLIYNDDTGFSLNIDGDNKIFSNEFSGPCAIGLHKKLIELEASYG